MMKRVIALLAAVAVWACAGSISSPGQGTVRFQLVAPLCSSVLPVQFLVDGQAVAADTFVVGISGRSHTTSDITTTSGDHVIGTRLYSTPTNGYRTVEGWDDRHVTLTAGATFVDSLPFYCS